MKKRIIAVLLTLMLCLQFVPINAFALSETTLTVSSKSGNRGDTVKLSVNISAGSNMQACDFELQYDKTVLEVVSVTKGALISSKGTSIINKNILGRIIVSYTTTGSAITSSGTLINAEFKIKKDAAYGKTAVKLISKEMANGSFDKINVTANSGSVTVNAPALDSPGNFYVVDVNSDSVELFWDAVYEATGYKLYMNGSLVSGGVISDNFFTVSGLQPETEYYFEVTTYHYTTESDKSEQLYITTKKANHIVAFVDWDCDVNNISDLDFESDYVLGVFEVEDGEQAPELDFYPVRTGYTFVCWDKPLTDIRRDTIIKAVYEVGPLQGDVNNDDEVDVNDATYLQKHLAGMTDASGNLLIDETDETQFLKADINNDGVINVRDVTFIQMFLADVVG